MKKREPLTFELTPLIDVVFILLTFFLVATTMKKNEKALNLELPNHGNNIEKELNNTLLIELSIDKIAINGEIISFENFEITISKLKREDSISLYIDKNVVYERVSEILKLLQKHNFNKISFIQKEF